MFPPAPVSAAVVEAAAPQQIGQAHMEPDGTIIMDLRVVLGAGVGDGRIAYSPADPRYAQVLKHLGGLKPGEFKPVFNDW